MADKMKGAVTVEDSLEYKSNKCTQQAREIEAIACRIVNSLWYDKHYINRNSVGEDDGSPREGIDPEGVRNLVAQVFNHLLFYSTILDKFQFVNHELNGKKARRILIQDSYSCNPTLNVIIETHFVDFNKYETTVVTAMAKEDFVPFDGQYILEVTGDYASVLKLYANKTYRILSSCQT